MKKLLICCAFIISQICTANLSANEFIKTEAILVLMAGISAKEPEAAAAVDALAMLSVPNSPDYKTELEQTIAYIGLGALAFYNYDAEEDGRTEEEIFNTNLIVFNIVLAGQLFGLSDSSSRLVGAEERSSTFSFQLSPYGGPRASWEYSFD
ncbi:MAG: hypothetical protein GY806_12065 [Gammaproteobacteria bacterium]|nr:hypothetical protein [Gammaproteobacteria bacterium]